MNNKTPEEMFDEFFIPGREIGKYDVCLLMKRYAEVEQKEFAKWVMNTPVNGRTLEKLWNDYQWQRALDEDNEVRKEAFHQRLP